MKTTTLFQNGCSQAVRLPKEFRFPGNKVFIKKVNNTTVLIPFNQPWQSLYNSLDKFSDDFMQEREQPDLQKRATFFD